MDMDTSSDLASQYLDFKNYEENLTEDEKHFKALTIIGASAVSLLCYEGDKLSEALQDDKFEKLRDADIISGVWPLGHQATTSARTTPLIAWSVRLQTVFIGFRGTQVAEDLITNIDARKTASPDLATNFHSGFFQQAFPFSLLVKELADKFRVVVCGHSLG